ncbi:DUF5590 domain-containing protein [Streptococcus suis]|nr:DUF5590 domain-containing protein [Streptococcus suis]
MEKSRRKKTKFILAPLHQYLIGSFVLLSVVVFSSLYLLENATHPFLEINSKAEKIARTYADLRTVEQVTIYNGSETYYSVLGETAEKQEIWVLIPESSSEIRVYPTNQGISEEEATKVAQENGASAADRVILGFRDDKPIWEVKSGTAYYLVNFETGDFIKKEGL